MSSISEWSTKEEENTHLDDLTLSGEGGLYTNKLMCAVKKKFDNVDGKLASVHGAYVFKGVKADMTALEAVTSPAVGDVYSVTALGGENYAWDGTAWDSLGTSDANVVHKTDSETITGEKTFTKTINIAAPSPFLALKETDYEKAGSATGYGGIVYQDKNGTELAKLEATFASTNDAYWKFTLNDNSSQEATGSVVFRMVKPVSGNAIFDPGATSAAQLGSSSRLWAEVFAAQGSINTSDERLKSFIDSVPDELLDAWSDVEWVQFKMAEAVARKGEQARVHSGLIAQAVADAFDAHGLDASRYGFFCHDQWEDQYDEQGTLVLAAGDRYSLRYQEALCLEAACQRRRADRLEARVAALEARLNGND